MAPVESQVAFQVGTGEKGKGLDESKHRLLKKPRGLHICSDGSLLVADYGNHCVLRFQPGDARGRVVAGEEGKPLPVVDPLSSIDKAPGPPEGEGFLLRRPICVHTVDDAIFVLDHDLCQVLNFPTDGSKSSVVIPPPGSKVSMSQSVPEAVKYPRKFAYRDDGSLVLCDTWSHRVLCFAPTAGDAAALPEAPTVLAGTPNSSGATPEKLSFPSSFAFAADGSLFVADTNNHRVQRFTPGASAATTVAGAAGGTPGAELGKLNMPTGICVDPRDGSLIVADRANSRVLRFAAGSMAGDQGVLLAGPDILDQPWDVCLGDGDALYVSDEARAVVLRLDLGGGGAPPQAAAQSPDGPELLE